MSHTLYRSPAGRNAEPHALPVTSRKERGTSRFIDHKPEGTQKLNIPHTLTGTTPEGRRNLSQAPRFAGSKYGWKRTPRWHHNPSLQLVDNAKTSSIISIIH
ncbi:hypothetical protein ACSBR1_039351 [Camellia fascicularis]